MADTHKTIADIIAEKRRQAEHIRNNLSTVPIRQWDQQAEIKSLEDEADRLDAAHKRELARVDAVIDEAVYGYPPEDIYDKRERGDCARCRFNSAGRCQDNAPCEEQLPRPERDDYETEN